MYHSNYYSGSANVDDLLSLHANITYWFYGVFF